MEKKILIATDGDCLEKNIDKEKNYGIIMGSRINRSWNLLALHT